MDDFKNFLKENNYEDDLEFQLCDLEMVFNTGKELQWKPSDEQIKAIKWIIDGDSPENWTVTLTNLYNDLKKLKE